MCESLIIEKTIAHCYKHDTLKMSYSLSCLVVWLISKEPSKD